VGDEVVVSDLEVETVVETTAVETVGAEGADSVVTEIPEAEFAFSGGIMEIAVLAMTANLLTVIRAKKSRQFWTFFFSLLRD